MSSTSDAAPQDEMRRTKDLMFLERVRDWLGVPTAAWGIGLFLSRLGILPPSFLAPARLTFSLVFVAVAGLVLITPVVFAAARTRSRSGVLTVAIVTSAIVVGFLFPALPEMRPW